MTDDFKQGDVLAERYQILGTLGRGGMATVYLAEDTTLARRVAIKVLHRRFAEDETFVERFRREAKAAAGLNHPNIVGVYDWGRLGAQNYIVMEYVQGETLKDRIRRRGRIEHAEAVAITLELLSALSAAHAKGVVHRDVKSHNILIDGAGRVKVADFGIAQAGDPSMTEAGSILGTAQYLAPEQARGDTVDERSDLYSVGVVLYEMLTGGVPFKGDTAVTVALRHVNEVPAAPATVVAGISPALNQVVMKALAKDPANRYANAGEFAHDLRSVRAGGPVAAAGFDPWEERTQMVRRPVPPPQAATPARRVAPSHQPGSNVARPPEKKPTPLWVYVTIALVAVAVIGGALAVVLATMNGGNSARVPDVVGLTQAAAVRALADAGFDVIQNETNSDDVDAGLVVRQQPQAGTELATSESVEIWVSSGPASVRLIDFRDRTPEFVETWLASNGLVGERKTGQNAGIEAGRVYRQQPAAGTAVERGATVTYWVSRGAPKVQVPYVIGLSSADAAAQIQQAGLVVGTTVQEFSDTVPSGQVIGQDPNAGTAVERGSEVSITVSSGPSPSPSPSVISVPEVVTMSQDQAQARLEGDFVVEVVPVTDSGQEPGTVVDQEPAAGTPAVSGSTVVIYVQQ